MAQHNWPSHWYSHGTSARALLHGPECRIDTLTICNINTMASQPHNSGLNRDYVLEPIRLFIQSIFDIVAAPTLVTINITAVESCKHLFCGTSQAVLHPKVVLKGCGVSPCLEADKRPDLMKEGLSPFPVVF